MQQNQGNFIPKMEWAASRSVMGNGSIVKLIASISSGGSLWCRPCY